VIEGKRVLAVVPARSGSKGIPDKNIRRLAGTTLIGWAGRVLAQLDWLDRKIISTDSKDYAEEGRLHGLEVPFLRPGELSQDFSSAIDTLVHALTECERIDGGRFDIVLIVEPTSPLRTAQDVEAVTRLLIKSGADSAVSVSAVPSKHHPAKVFRLEDQHLRFFAAAGAGVIARQSLEPLYSRNGVCYSLTRECVLNKRQIITEQTVGYLIDRHVVNIDEEIELEWAEFLLARQTRVER
jgi:CMP-N,N'-diacetyllegionaminic acid synthase